ncbi:MAG: hypothetical protein OEM42_05830 [Deltaproteobacteria bacterium]|nr:hypothetical protein [Deltaproteobacteria bacterium]
MVLWSPFAAMAMLVCISGVLSLWSGWQRIARKFPYREIPDSRRYAFVRMSLGSGLYPVGYGGVVFVRLSPHGIGLSVIFLIRFFHPPIFIPWSEVARCAREMVRGTHVTILSLRGEASEFAFYGKLGESINQTYLSGKSAKTI